MTRVQQYVFLMWVLSSASNIFADSSSPSRISYPDSALVDVMSQEDIERKKADELEEKAARQRAEYEKRKREVELKISAYKSNIENLRVRQERAQQDIESLNTEMGDVDGKIDSLKAKSASFEESVQKTTEYLDNMRNELTLKQKELSERMLALQKAKSDAENSIYNKSLDIQRLKNQLAEAETRTREAEASRASLEAEEMNTRTLWMQTKLNVADKNNQKDQAVAAAKEAKEKHAKAARDLAAARQDLANAEKNRAEVAKRTSTEIARFESEIVNASKARVGAEAEKIRLETEVNKLQDFAARIKSNRDAAVQEAEDASSMVMKSRVAVETARTELNTQMQAEDQAHFKRDKEAAQTRGLAAASEAADLFAGARRWVATGKCQSRGKPNLKSPTVTPFASGNRIMARETSNPEWIEVINGSGLSSYLESRCGRFEN